jgi:hypothetical protein
MNVIMYKPFISIFFNSSLPIQANCFLWHFVAWCCCTPSVTTRQPKQFINTVHSYVARKIFIHQPFFHLLQFFIQVNCCLWHFLACCCCTPSVTTRQPKLLIPCGSEDQQNSRTRGNRRGVKVETTSVAGPNNTQEAASWRRATTKKAKKKGASDQNRSTNADLSPTTSNGSNPGDFFTSSFDDLQDARRGSYMFWMVVGTRTSNHCYCACL